MNLISPVCRTCLGIISEGKTGYNIDDENGLIKNVRNIREMIQFCVPEMDIYISVSPSICETCLGVLINIYNFKIRCMRVENAIRSYIVANNVMEGSCVDLSNVVRQQIVEALRQKNWPPDVIRDYIAKVDKCLKTSKKRVPPEVFNTMSQNFNIESFQNIPTNVSKPPANAALNFPNTANLPNSLSLKNPPLNNLLNGSAAVSSSQQVLTDPQDQNAPTKYLTVSKNLMAERQDINNTVHMTDTTPNLMRHGPPSLPSARLLPGVEHFQNTFLSTLNLISSDRGGREEAVLVTPEERHKRISNSTASDTTNSNSASSSYTVTHELCPNTGILKKVRTKKPKPLNSNSASSSYTVTHELCPNTGVLKKVRTKKPKPLIRKYLGPKSKRKDKNIVAKGDIVILDDECSTTTKEKVAEVLIMNFDDSENVVEPEKVGEVTTLEALLKSSDALESTSDSSKEPDFLRNMVVKVPLINKELLKRKLTPEDILEEILSKRRRLIVKLNPSLPYLHTKKRVVVKIQNEKFFKCVFCNFATLKPESLETHHIGWHRVCKLCNYKCDKKVALDQHIDIHHLADLKKVIEILKEDKVDYNCYLCNFVGLSAFDLRDHRIRIHIKCDLRGIYKCPFTPCDTEDAIAYNIARHIDNKHDSPRRRQCVLCNYMGPSIGSLKLHVQSHSVITKMVCPLCGARCKTDAGLDKHMKKKHVQVKGQKNIAGMVYAPTPGRLGTLTTGQDGRITLDLPGPSTGSLNPDTAISVEGRCSFDLPSLGEILCSQTFQEIPEQEDDCTIVSGPVAKIPARQKTIILNKHNKKSRKTSAPDDTDDCVIIPECQPEIISVDLSDEEDTILENPTKRQKTTQKGTIISRPQDDSDTVVVSRTETCLEQSAVGILERLGCPDLEPETLKGSASQSKESQDNQHDGESICNDENIQKESAVSNPQDDQQSADESRSRVEVEKENNSDANNAGPNQNNSNKEDNLASKALETLLDEHFTENGNGPSASQPQKVDAVFLESVLIESSDEDSNDCTIVSQEDTESHDTDGKSKSEQNTNSSDLSKIVVNKEQNDIGSNISETSSKDEGSTDETSSIVGESGNVVADDDASQQSDVNCTKKTDESTGLVSPASVLDTADLSISKEGNTEDIGNLVADEDSLQGAQQSDVNCTKKTSDESTGGLASPASVLDTADLSISKEGNTADIGNLVADEDSLQGAQQSDVNCSKKTDKSMCLALPLSSTEASNLSVSNKEVNEEFQSHVRDTQNVDDNIVISDSDPDDSNLIPNLMDDIVQENLADISHSESGNVENTEGSNNCVPSDDSTSKSEKEDLSPKSTGETTLGDTEHNIKSMERKANQNLNIAEQIIAEFQDPDDNLNISEPEKVVQQIIEINDNSKEPIVTDEDVEPLQEGDKLIMLKKDETCPGNNDKGSVSSNNMASIEIENEKIGNIDEVTEPEDILEQSEPNTMPMAIEIEESSVEGTEPSKTSTSIITSPQKELELKDALCESIFVTESLDSEITTESCVRNDMLEVESENVGCSKTSDTMAIEIEESSVEGTEPSKTSTGIITSPQKELELKDALCESIFVTESLDSEITNESCVRNDMLDVESENVGCSKTSDTSDRESAEKVDSEVIEAMVIESEIETEERERSLCGITFVLDPVTSGASNPLASKTIECTKTSDENNVNVTEKIDNSTEAELSNFFKGVGECQNELDDKNQTANDNDNFRASTNVADNSDGETKNKVIDERSDTAIIGTEGTNILSKNLDNETFQKVENPLDNVNIEIPCSQDSSLESLSVVSSKNIGQIREAIKIFGDPNVTEGSEETSDCQNASGKS